MHGLTIREVIALVAQSANVSLDRVALDGDWLDLDDTFDDYYESRAQLFVFSNSQSPSAAPCPSPRQPPGAEVSHWVRDFSAMRTLRHIGQGSFGTVRLVEDRATGELIALKTFY
jgi:hypothetical protein